jgi:hypothetical protein
LENDIFLALFHLENLIEAPVSMKKLGFGELDILKARKKLDFFLSGKVL